MLLHFLKEFLQKFPPWRLVELLRGANVHRLPFYWIVTLPLLLAKLLFRHWRGAINVNKTALKVRFLLFETRILHFWLLLDPAADEGGYLLLFRDCLWRAFMAIRILIFFFSKAGNVAMQGELKLYFLKFLAFQDRWQPCWLLQCSLSLLLFESPLHERSSIFYGIFSVGAMKPTALAVKLAAKNIHFNRQLFFTHFLLLFQLCIIFSGAFFRPRDASKKNF